MKRDSEQHTAKKPRKGRGPTAGSFIKGDPRINRQGVPAEALAFQRAMRQTLAEELSKPSDSDPGERVFESMIQRLVALAKAGERWAIEMVLDRSSLVRPGRRTSPAPRGAMMRRVLGAVQKTLLLGDAQVIETARAKLTAGSVPEAVDL